MMLFLYHRNWYYQFYQERYVFISNINYQVMDSINEKGDSKGERHITIIGYANCIPTFLPSGIFFLKVLREYLGLFFFVSFSFHWEILVTYLPNKCHHLTGNKCSTSSSAFVTGVGSTEM